MFPVTIPVAPTLATAVLLLVHAPPVDVVLNVIVAPAQTVVSPEIIPANGSGLTVTTCVAAAVPQLLVTEYDMVVVLAATPLTIPDVPTIAIASLALVHEPPAMVLPNEVVLPTQTDAIPVIEPATGKGFTVTDVVYTVAGLQPGWLLPSLTVRLYTPVTVGVAVGLAIVNEDRAEPLQLYTVAPPAPLAVRFTVPPTHIGPLLAGDAVGVAFTVTDVVYTVDGLQPASAVPSLTVRLYTVVAVGVAVGLAIEEDDNEVPLQLYTDAPPAPLAVRLTVPPLQM